MGRTASASGKRVLLAVDEGPTGSSLLSALDIAAVETEWVRTIAELKARAVRSDLPAPKVVFLDLELTESSADEIVLMVRGMFPQAQIIALAGPLSGEEAARLLWQGVPYLNKPVNAPALAGLALRLLSPGRARKSWPPTRYVPEAKDRGAHFESIIRSYSTDRVLSRQQQLILREYLTGKNDKEIAESCRCSEATVYEHWRRMARKAGGSQKSDVIADFHRFLGGT
jgi:DNA-binding NarL/FixJ family response regulator